MSIFFLLCSCAFALTLADDAAPWAAFDRPLRVPKGRDMLTQQSGESGGSQPFAAPASGGSLNNSDLVQILTAQNFTNVSGANETLVTFTIPDERLQGGGAIAFAGFNLTQLNVSSISFKSSFIFPMPVLEKLRFLNDFQLQHAWAQVVLLPFSGDLVIWMDELLEGQPEDDRSHIGKAADIFALQTQVLVTRMIAVLAAETEGSGAAGTTNTSSSANSTSSGGRAASINAFN